MTTETSLLLGAAGTLRRSGALAAAVRPTGTDRAAATGGGQWRINTFNCIEKVYMASAGKKSCRDQFSELGGRGAAVYQFVLFFQRAEVFLSFLVYCGAFSNFLLHICVQGTWGIV